MPGPLTITLPKSDLVPDRATGGLPRVALRCPDHDGCRVLLQRAGVPIERQVLIFQAVPVHNGQDVYNDMNGRISYILDAGPCTIGVESTVVEVHMIKLLFYDPVGLQRHS